MSSFFSVVQDAVKHELKTRAGEVQTKLKEQVEKAVLRVEESNYYKQHVEFNEANYFQLEDEVFEEENEEVVVVEEELRFKDPVGRLVISMLSCCKLAVGKAPDKLVHVEIHLEHISQRTRATTQYAWTNDVFEFPVYDLKSTLRIKVLVEGGLAKQDVLLGQVLIPVETLLPPFSLHYAEQAVVVEQNKPKVYMLFPLDADKLEFECKAMTKPKQELGYLRCCTKLELAVPKENVFATYAKSPQFHSSQENQSQRTRKIPSTIRTAKTLQQLAQLQQRFAIIALKLVFGPFALTAPFVRARECTNVVYTSTFVLVVCMVVLFAESHLFPLFLWALIMLGGYMSCSSSPAIAASEQLLVWNEKDADALNPLQQVTLLLWVTERMVMVLGLIADGIERIINALEFKDVRASLVVLGGGGFLVSLGTSLLAYCIPWRIVACLAFLTWTFSSVDYVELVQSLRTRVLRFVSPKQRKIRRSETSRWFAFTNYMAKIPTSQHLAHLKICEQQRLGEEQIQARDLQFPG